MYRVINTANESPSGLEDIADRPWVVLRTCGKREVISGRFATQKWALEYVRLALLESPPQASRASHSS